MAIEPHINGWGINDKNHRFIASAAAGINRSNVDQLQVKWVFALPDTKTPHFQPLITANTVVIADEPGVVYALDRETGCQRWQFDAGSTVRTALRQVDTDTGPLLSFGTADAEVFGLELATGKLRWRLQADTHRFAMVSGSAIDSDGVIYQPVSSWEAAYAVNPFYACCTFRSSLLAIDAQSGVEQWRSYTIVEAPAVIEKRGLLPDRLGPSGAPVWSQPTLDSQRGRIYVGTGENYSSPATETSDAIIAFDAASGEMLWHQQFLAGDAWNVSCESPITTNCPEERGVDLDFGAPPVLVTVDGRDYILAGQRSGAVYALDPDQGGALLWSQKPGTGGKLGGVHFALAVDPSRGVLYVPISDRPIKILGDNPVGEPNPSLHAYDIASGELLWSVAAPDSCGERGKPNKGCHPGLSAAPTATEELVFAPALDGAIHAFDAADGELLWSFETAAKWPAVNGGEARGGAIDLGGVYLDRGQLFVSSGYGTFDQWPGNAFIVMEVADE